MFSNEGTSWMVTAVDPLLVLNCSMWFPSTLLSSTLGSRKLFSGVGFELWTPPDTEAIPTGLSGQLLWPVDCVIFWRGLEPPLAPRTLDACVRLATSKKEWCDTKLTYFIVGCYSATWHVMFTNCLSISINNSYRNIRGMVNVSPGSLIVFIISTTKGKGTVTKKKRLKKGK